MEKYLSKFTVLEPRLDWISIVGDIPNIMYEEAEVSGYIEKQFLEWGFVKMKKRERLAFRSDLFGTEISLGKKRNTGDRFIKIEVQGKGCSDSVENTEVKIKEMIKKVWEFLGVATPPHATRIDLAVDIMGARCSDIFPDLSDKNIKLVSESKHERKPTLSLAKFYKNTTDLTEQTGFTIGNSRFEICVYDRILALNDKYIHQENGRAYYDYYSKLYKSHKKVLRIETRLTKELCDFFNIAFFSEKKTLREILPLCLAHFNHNHNFKNVQTGENIEAIDRLYFSENYKSIKTLKSELQMEIDLEKLFFNLGSKNYEVRISQLARSLVRSGKTKREDLKEVFDLLLQEMKFSSATLEKEILDFKKTCKFLNFQEDKQAQREQEFLKAVNDLFKQRVSLNSMSDGFIFSEFEEKMRKLGII